MAKATNICRKCILNLKPYVPGKPIEEVKRELGIDDIVKLASNKKPSRPIAPKALAAMTAGLDNAALYPEGSCFELRQVLAKRLPVNPDMLIFGAGADEVIHYLGIALLEDGDEIVQAHPSFVQYQAASTLMDCVTRSAPLKNWTHDLDAMLQLVNDKTKLFFITNPNNPTGTIVSSDAIKKVLDSLPERCILVLDEAYYEYVDDPKYTRSIDWVREGRERHRAANFLQGLCVGGPENRLRDRPDAHYRAARKSQGPFQREQHRTSGRRREPAGIRNR